MASVYADPKLRNKRHYIAASTFNSYVYGYSTTMNSQFVTTGALTVLPSATTSGKCPQGRILREVGNRLYPDAHPGVSTMMVQVYDANSGVRGYIDPNAPVFAVYNSDKPVEIVDGTEVGNGTAHKGQPVFTTGDVLAGGALRAYTVTTDSTTVSGTLTINPALGNYFRFTGTLSGSVTLAASSAPAGQVVYVQFTSGGGQTLSEGTNVDLNTNVTLTASKKIFLVLISDGTTFSEVSRLIYT